MKYQIFYGSYLLHAPSGKDAGYILPEAALDMAVGTAGTLTFTIGEEHPNYAQLVMRKSAVEVTGRDGQTVFRGRIIRDTRRMGKLHEIECEGAAACLNDTLMPPYSVPEDYAGNAAYLAAVTAGTVPAWWLGELIAQHNGMCWLTENRVQAGTVTVKSASLSAVCEDWQTIWDAIGTLQDALGGYIVVRYEDDATYIDYLAEITDANGQEIVEGINLIDLEIEAMHDDYCNALIPLGAELDGGGRLSAQAAADGYYGANSEYYKSGFYIETPAQRDRFGNAVRRVIWDDVTTAAELMTRAVAYLDAHAWDAPRSVSVEAVDRSDTDADAEPFEPAKTVRLASRSGGFDMTLPLVRVRRDLLTGDVALTLSAEVGAISGDVAGGEIGAASASASAGGVAVSTLWENDAPSSSFAAQTVSISGLSNYDLIMIEVAYSATNSTIRAGTTVGYEAGAIARSSVTGYSGSTVSTCYRSCTLAADSITFSTGTRATGSSVTDGTSYAIPVRVVGIKY